MTADGRKKNEGRQAFGTFARLLLAAAFHTGRTVTLDLNNHKLSQNRTESDSDGHVIWVRSGTLNILDNVSGHRVTRYFFEAIELEIIRLRNVDIITSSPKYEDDETEKIPA